MAEVYTRNPDAWAAFFDFLGRMSIRTQFTANDVIEAAQAVGLLRDGISRVVASASLSSSLRSFVEEGGVPWGELKCRQIGPRTRKRWVFSFSPSDEPASAVTASEMAAAFDASEAAPSQADETAMIPFHGSALRVAKDGEQVYVAIRPICEHLGIAANGQLEKRRQDGDFELVSYLINSTDGKNYEMACLPQEQLLGWLYTIGSNRVSPESRQMLKAYRQETTQAISDYWTKGQATRSTLPAIDLSALQRVASLEKTLQEVVNLVPQAIHSSVEVAKDELRQDFNARIGELQATSEEQGEVKRLVREISARRKRAGMRNWHWAAVYTEAWDTCKVGSIQVMTRAQVPKVLAYLHAQLAAIDSLADSGLFEQEGADSYHSKK